MNYRKEGSGGKWWGIMYFKLFLLIVLNDISVKIETRNIQIHFVPCILTSLQFIHDMQLTPNQLCWYFLKYSIYEIIIRNKTSSRA